MNDDIECGECENTQVFGCPQCGQYYCADHLPVSKHICNAPDWDAELGDEDDDYGSEHSTDDYGNDK